MKPIVRNSFAVLVGVVIGGSVNMGLIEVGMKLIPPPGDVGSMEALKESMKLFTPRNFIFPFVAHAVGTLVGAYLAALIATKQPLKFALCIGGFFLLGGTVMVVSVGGPIWFNVLDLLLAYIPMAFLGAFLADRARSTEAVSQDAK